MGDSVTICGVYNGLSEISDSSTVLYHRSLGYKKSFDSFKDWIISEESMKEYSDLVSLPDEESLDNIPEFTTIYGDIENDDKLTKIYEKLKKEFQFPIELEINEINFGISDVGQVGTYSVYDKCSI